MSLKTVDVDDDRRAATARALADAEALLRREREEREEREDDDDDEEREDFANQARSIHWFPYDRVDVVDADP